MSLVRVRIALGEIVLLVLNSLASFIYLLEKAHQYRKLLRKLAFWLLNPKVFAVALDVPSFIGLFATVNAVITDKLAWGPGPMQITLLAITRIGISAPLLFTPTPRRGDSYIKFNPS